MSTNAMRRNLRQSIIRSLGRYIAIVLIIALGSCLFVGLLMTKQDMVATGQVFTTQQNMFDFRLVSTYGWSDEQVEQAKHMEGVALAEGVFYQDVICQGATADEVVVYRFYNMPEAVNQIALQGGRMPQQPWECLADGYFNDDSVLGTKVLVSATNDEDTLEALKYETYTVVGYVSTPLYMDMNRGTTSVGTGKVENYFYIPWDGISADYYTQIDLKLNTDYPIYSDQYNDYLDDLTPAMESEAERLGQERFEAVKIEAEEAYQEGYQEYLDGLQEYYDGKAEFEQELADARQELEDAELKIQASSGQLLKAEQQLDDASKEIEANRALLDAQEADLDAKEAQIKAALPQAKACVTQLQTAVDAAKAAMAPETPESILSTVTDLNAKIALIESGNADESLAAQYDSLKAKRDQLQGALNTYNSYLSQLNTAKNTVSTLEKYLNTDIPAGRALIAENRAKLQAGEDTISSSRAQIRSGRKQLEEAREELAQGWIDYEEGKLEGEQELADAWEELEEGRLELEDAREEIDSMEPVDVFVLDRNTNVGYNSLDSSSDIVAGVSRVLPIFFLLVASLVCVTTMSRMIEEERTQIGTLKALGYSTLSIMSKYLVYSGSAAVLGGLLGVFLGSTVIPMILWKVYGIMLYIQPQVVLTVNWGLSIAVILVYTLAMLFVSWYCCRKTLMEEPAELIRPKAPDAGKKILLEHLPFWKRISFLNKVTLRNIFRYRQRLAMMLVGIGGCTALLVTGFGLRDSIVGVVDYQFREITTYHMEVYFDGHQFQEDREIFCDQVSPQTESILFYHQSSVDLEFGNTAKEIFMISGDEDLTQQIHMEKNGTPVELPGMDQVVLSTGVAKILGIRIGDTVTIRDPDLRTMELTVSGIYENHLNNYCFIAPETIEKHFGEAPEMQMAMVRVGEGIDQHELGAHISEMDNVLNVSVTEDMASMITKMMSALDLVVVVIVVCAGLLAFIVLYNLTNININERIREIATIKVLGFKAGETAAYVFKENMALTVAGSAFGLLLGRGMLEFVMSQIKVDIVWFRTLIDPKSYVIAIILTLISACIVNFVFYFKLETINMAEALKSVE